MKNLLKFVLLISVFKTCQTIAAQNGTGFVPYNLEEQEMRLRERYSEINIAGGVVRGKRGEQSVGCRTLKDLTEYESFVRYGKGFPPSSDRCWPLKDGARVKIRIPAVDSGLLHNGCTEKFDICLFDPGWFGKNFVTHTYRVEPIK